MLVVSLTGGTHSQSVCFQMTRERLLGGMPLSAELAAVVGRDNEALTPCSFSFGSGAGAVPSLIGARHGCSVSHCKAARRFDQQPVQQVASLGTRP